MFKVQKYLLCLLLQLHKEVQLSLHLTAQSCPSFTVVLTKSKVLGEKKTRLKKKQTKPFSAAKLNLHITAVCMAILYPTKQTSYVPFQQEKNLDSSISCKTKFSLKKKMRTIGPQRVHVIIDMNCYRCICYLWCPASHRVFTRWPPKNDG